MTTAFKTVQDALVAALVTPATIVGLRVVAGRARPMPAEHDSDIAISIESVQGEDFTLTAQPQDWAVVYGVEIRARGSVSVDAIAALDPLLEAVYARIKSTPAPAGVMGWVLEPRLRFEVEEAATPIGTLQLALNVRMRTQPGSLALAA
jgi:hypothetical protein